jgi:hypothetical protein
VPAEILDSALFPDVAIAALRRLGGGHYHGVAYFNVEARREADPKEGSVPASPSAITTTTDLWVDGLGNFRILESNDQEGGREIVRVGNEVGVALRYGKMVRRSTQDSESARFLAEVLGAPWAAWEIVRRDVLAEGSVQAGVRLKLGSHQKTWPPGFLPTTALRAWRASVAVKTLEGMVQLDPASHAVRMFACKTQFSAMRDQVPVDGEMAVSLLLDEVGQVAEVTMPTAETLHTRQRTVLEERALLGGLGKTIAGAAGKAAETGGTGRAGKSPGKTQ